MEQLRFPPDDRASVVFVHATSEQERVRRLVETFFGAYERGADGITAARRERDDVPAVRESMEALDSSFAALVVEALRPVRRRCASRAPRPRWRSTGRARRWSAGSTRDPCADES